MILRYSLFLRFFAKDKLKSIKFIEIDIRVLQLILDVFLGLSVFVKVCEDVIDDVILN